MRVLKFFVSALVVASVAIGTAHGQAERKAPGGGEVRAPKGTVLAPSKASKSQTNTAPRPATAAPLTAEECKGLGGKVVQSAACMIFGQPGGGSACSTVDPNGVVRTKCINR